MRKTAPIVISLSVVLVIGLLCAGMRARALATSAVTPQNAPFVWTLANEEKDYPGYKRVEGGKLKDGTRLDICRAGYIPGKVYQNLCLYPYAGAEGTFRYGYYEVLLTNAQYEWKSADDVSRAEIKGGAVKGGTDKDGADTLYICRKKMSDGVHPGKYSYKNRLCYIPWGGKEYFYRTNFEILFR